jgi:hypothetical protein
MVEEATCSEDVRQGFVVVVALLVVVLLVLGVLLSVF